MNPKVFTRKHIRVRRLIGHSDPEGPPPHMQAILPPWPRPKTPKVCRSRSPALRSQSPFPPGWHIALRYSYFYITLGPAVPDPSLISLKSSGLNSRSWGIRTSLYLACQALTSPWSYLNSVPTGLHAQVSQADAGLENLGDCTMTPSHTIFCVPWPSVVQPFSHWVPLSHPHPKTFS